MIVINSHTSTHHCVLSLTLTSSCRWWVIPLQDTLVSYRNLLPVHASDKCSHFNTSQCPIVNSYQSMKSDQLSHLITCQCPIINSYQTMQSDEFSHFKTPQFPIVNSYQFMQSDKFSHFNTSQSPIVNYYQFMLGHGSPISRHPSFLSLTLTSSC